MNEAKTSPTTVIASKYHNAAKITESYIEQLNHIIDMWRAEIKAIYPNSQSYGIVQLMPVFMVDSATDISQVKSTFYDADCSTVWTYDVDGVDVREQMFPF